MKIGLVLPMSEADGPGADRWPQIRRLALAAEQGGLDSLWLYDHLIFRGLEEGGGEGSEGGLHEAWTLLAAVAAVTERVELGTIVLGTAFRPPALTAKMAQTLDEVSDGRLILGLGTGWHEPEYTAFGYPFDHRAGRFEEALEIIVPLTRGERVTFEGRWHHVEDAVLIPPPPRGTRLPGRMPILIAAKGDRVLGLTAKWADAWNAAWFGVPDERWASRRADLLRVLEAEGRDPATMELTAGVTIGETSPQSLPKDAGVIASAFDRWRDEGVGTVQLSVGELSEADVQTIVAAMRTHRGEA